MAKLFLHKLREGDRSRGPLPRVLFLHGMAGIGPMFRTHAETLQSGASVFALDQRGHGYSRRPFIDGDLLTGDLVSPDEMAEESWEAMDQLDLLGGDSWVLCGHSMGVRTALRMASLRPDSVRAVIACDLSLTGLAGGGLGDRLKQYIESMPDEFSSILEARTWLFEHAPESSMGMFVYSVIQLWRKELHQSQGTPVQLPFNREIVLSIINGARESQSLPSLQNYLAAGGEAWLLRGARSGVYSDEAWRKDCHDAAHPRLHCEVWQKAGHGLPFERRVDLCRLLDSICSSSH